MHSYEVAGLKLTHIYREIHFLFICLQLASGHLLNFLAHAVDEGVKTIPIIKLRDHRRVY